MMTLVLCVGLGDLDVWDPREGLEGEVWGLEQPD